MSEASTAHRGDGTAPDASSDTDGRRSLPDAVTTAGDMAAGSVGFGPWNRSVVRWPIAVLAALAVAALAVALRQNGLVSGYRGAVLSGLVLLAVPTSRLLARRIVIVGCVAFGFVPLTYVSALPVGTWGRVTIALAIVTGGLTLFTVASRSPLDRLRQMVPRVGTVDLLVLVTAAATAFTLKAWITVQTGEASLAILFRGWDHSAHYFMTEAARRTGAFADLLGTAANGDHYKFAQYPSSFHVVAAAVMELLGGPAVGSPSDELVLYSHAIGICAVIALTITIAGVCSLPVVRRNRSTAIPLVTAIGATFLLGPGGSLIRDGFPNFFVACALLATIPTLVVTWGKVFAPLTVLAVGGAISAIAGSWALLLVIAAPAALLGLAPLRRHRWSSSTSDRAIAAIVLVATIYSAARAASVLSRTTPSFDELVVIPGGVTAPPAGQVALLTLAALAACLWPFSRQPGTQGRRRVGQVIRVAWLWVPVAIGAAAAKHIADVALRTTPDVGYYFWKFSMALALFAVVVLVVALASHSWGPAQGSWRTALRRFAAAIIAALAVSQAYGVALPSMSNAGFGPMAPGVAAALDMRSATTDPQLNTNTRRLIAATTIPAVALGSRPVWFDPNSFGQSDPIQSAQWFLTLTGNWTEESNATVSGLQFSYNSLADGVAIVKQVLIADPQAVFVISADFADKIRDGMNAPGLAERILTAPA